MLKITNQFKRFIMMFSQNAREERAYSRYKTIYSNLNRMSHDQLIGKMTELKSMFEYRKTVFVSMMIVVILTVITEVWKKVYDIVMSGMSLVAINELDANSYFILMVFLVICTITIIVILFVSVLTYLKNTYCIYRQMLIVEVIMKSRGIEGD